MLQRNPYRKNMINMQLLQFLQLLIPSTRKKSLNCSTSHEMRSQLQAYHDQHSDECIIALQE